MILSVLILLTSQFFGVQGEFSVILKDIEYSFHDPEYITEPDAYINENNEVFCKFSIIKTFPSTSEGYMALIGASMGEYVIDTGMSIRMPLCEMFNEPIILGPILRLFGLEDNNCPPEPGDYGSENMTIPTSMYPDDFPPNEYRSTFEISNEGARKRLVQMSLGIIQDYTEYNPNSAGYNLGLYPVESYAV